MIRKEIRGFIKKNNLEESRMNKLEIKSRKQEGITLIALIITVIIMLILAGVTISALMKDGRLFERTQVAVDLYSEASNKESELIHQLEAKFDEISGEAILQVEDANPGILSGSGTESDPYLIESIEDLMAFSNAVNGMGSVGNRIVTNRNQNLNNANFYEGECVKLACNLDFESDLSYVDPTRTDFGDVNGNGVVESLKDELIKKDGKGFFPIGSTTLCSFKGNFLGDNHVIKNLYINNGVGVGFFGYVENSKISDFQLTGEIISLAFGNSTGGCGCLAYGACGDVEISNFINRCNIQGRGESGVCHAGVIASYELASKLHLNNVINRGNITGDTLFKVGGLIGSGKWIGNHEADIIIENSGNYGELTINCGKDINAKKMIGGIICEMKSIKGTNSRIVNCYNKGKIRLTNTDDESFVGGIIGYSYSTPEFRIENCKNYADISISGAHSYANVAAGIVARQRCVDTDNSIIENCANYGNLSAINNKENYDNAQCFAIASGICGLGSTKIYNCENYGKISSDGGKGVARIASSGIFGIIISPSVAQSEAEVDGCKNYGEIEGNLASGIVGNTYSYREDCSIINSCNVGKITGSVVSGIANKLNISSSIQNSYNLGELNSTNLNNSCGIFNSSYAIELLNCYNISPAGRGILTTRTDNTNLANLYYLDTCCSDPGSTVCEAKTEAFMKSQDFIDLLNANVEEHNSSSEIVWKTWVRDENTGYPIISE